MLYITSTYNELTEDSSIKNIWEIKGNVDPEVEYKKFIHEKAEELGIIINPHWLNLMNGGIYNQHLSVEEYQDMEKRWNKILRQWNIDKFISEKLGGKKQKFKEL
jgi:hypothetical protein